MSLDCNNDSLLDFGYAKMEQLMLSFDQPAYRAKQVIAWLHKHDCNDTDDMSNLSKSLRQQLKQKYEIVEPELALVRPASDLTHKFLFRLHDGNLIETVYIPESNRATLCVSSQVGCALNCDFCSTGKEGFNRNLTLSEVISQLRMVKRWVQQQQQLQPQSVFPQVSNVVFMGMGEPLLNYDVLVETLQLMLSDDAYGLSKYKVTVSTSGLVPKMLELKKASDCAMAVSLHAATDDLRTSLVPLNRKYALKELMAACKDYFEAQPRRKVTFEYVMLDGVNDRLEDAKALVKLVKTIPCKMNLIPFNSFKGTRYKRSSEKNIYAFQAYLIKNGVDTWVRKTRGDSVDAACGQLVGEVDDRTGRHKRWKATGSVITKKSNKEITDV